MEAASAEAATRRIYKQPLTLFHPNTKGTGAAIRLEPRINTREGDNYNCFFLEMARQKSSPNAGEGDSRAASFDWQNKITVKLNFTDLCEFLAVLEGKAAQAGSKRDGLYHRNGDTSTLITFSPQESGGYAIGLSRKRAGDEEPSRVRMILSEIEAVGLRHILAVGLFFITLPAAAA